MRGTRPVRPAWYAIDERRKGCCRRLPARFCCAWVCFVLLLTFGFYMAHPTLPPASSQSVGSQAFHPLGDLTAAKAQTDAQNGSTMPATSNVNLVGGVTGPSYPLDAYAPQMHNPIPLTEVTVHSCFPLWLKKCKPLTTAAKNARLGPWVLVDRPLNADTAASSSKKITQFGIPSLDFFGQLMASFETKYIFYRRSIRSDVPKVVDLRLVQTGSDNRPVGGDYAGWHRVKTDIRTTILTVSSHKMPVHLYYRTIGGSAQDKDGEEGMASPLTAEEKALNSDPITEIDVLYGTGPAWPDFAPIGVVVQRNEDLKVAQVTLAARRTSKQLPQAPAEPLFRDDGTFKVMQLADLHYSVRHEACREVGWESSSKPCVADNDTIAMIGRWLDEEKPDMVVFSGDQLNGQGTSWDEKSVIPKWVKPVIDRKIPWASIQGNHDSQSGVLSRAEQQALLSRLPYSLTRVGPSHLHDGNGAGNFYVKLRSPKPDGIHLFTLYFLDSGEYAPADRWHPFTFAGYDWVRQDQIDWLLDVSKKMANIERPYTPDGGKDLGPIWRRAAGADDGLLDGIRRVKRQASPSTATKSYLSKPKAFLFVHIPVPEAFGTPDNDSLGKPAKFGDMREPKTIEGAQKKKGLFDAVRDRPQEEQDVVAMFHGHMHNNAGCRRVSKVWVCFNGGSSFAAYGLKDFERRARVIQISEWGQRVSTWQRYETTPGRMEEHELFVESTSTS